MFEYSIANQEAIASLDSSILDNASNPVISVVSERNHRYVACLAAISMLGYAVGPVDEQWPISRIKHAVRVTRPVLLVVFSSGNSEKAKHLSAYACQLKIKVCEVECPMPQELQVGSFPNIYAPRGAVSYCIFTSGSFESPRGCLGTWRALGSRCRWYQEDVLSKLEPSRKYRRWMFRAGLSRLYEAGASVLPQDESRPLLAHRSHLLTPYLKSSLQCCLDSI